MTRILIKQARLLDPASQMDSIGDVLIENGVIHSISPQIDAECDRLIEAAGCWLLPGLVDLRVSLKGHVPAETRAALAGGVTHLCVPPDAQTVIDNPAAVRLILDQASAAGPAQVHLLGALTQQLGGSQLSNMQALKQAGCLGVTNLYAPLQDNRTLLRALEYAATMDLPVHFNSQDAALAAGGCAHDGAMAAQLGLPGIPAVAETIALARDLLLVERTGVRAHFAQISTAGGVELIRIAKARGLPVTADVSIHNLCFDESAIAGYNSTFHVMPPLRHPNDQVALMKGLKDGTLDAICSNHRPCAMEDKLAPFPATAAGISGVETLLCQAAGLDFPPLMLARLLCQAPADVLGIDAGRLEPGQTADLCLFDPESEHLLTQESLVSSGKNTPLLRKVRKGQVRLALASGTLIEPAAYPL